MKLWLVGLLAIGGCESGSIDDDAAPPTDAGASTDGALSADAPVFPDVAVAPVGWSAAPAVATGAVQENGVVAIGSSIYVVGGFGALADELARVSVYDTHTERWRAAADLPLRLHHANVAAVDGRLYLLGFLTGFDFAEDGRGFVYDPATDAWEAGPTMPAGAQRGASGVAVLGSRIYIVGGLAGRRAVARCDGYDVATGEWFDVPDLPRAADHMAAGEVGGAVVVAGGRSRGIRAHTGETHVLDPAAGVWRTVSPMPTPRGGVAAAGHDGRLYVFGGEGSDAESGVFEQVEAYHLATDTWTRLAPMPTPRHGTGAAWVDGVVYIPGGADRQAFGAVDVHERLRP